MALSCYYILEDCKGESSYSFNFGLILDTH